MCVGRVSLSLFLVPQERGGRGVRRGGGAGGKIDEWRVPNPLWTCGVTASSADTARTTSQPFMWLLAGLISPQCFGLRGVLSSVWLKWWQDCTDATPTRTTWQSQREPLPAHQLHVGAFDFRKGWHSSIYSLTHLLVIPLISFLTTLGRGGALQWTGSFLQGRGLPRAPLTNTADKD